MDVEKKKSQKNMTKNNFKTDLTFFTNEPNTNLLDRFIKTLKDVKYFDILVGYFRSADFLDFILKKK